MSAEGANEGCRGETWREGWLEGKDRGNDGVDIEHFRRRDPASCKYLRPVVVSPLLVSSPLRDSDNSYIIRPQCESSTGPED